MTFEATYETRIICNREVRRIPAGWQHPKDERGRYVPLYDRAYYADLLRELQADEPRPTVGQMPQINEPGYEIAAYETTSEGTPVSPAFPDTPQGRLDLVNWCAENATTWADNRADAEAWAAILFGEDLASIGLDGSVRFP
jgi:hypothetical protein